jgi:serine phosphatase RsbU (regulator of sigma subunit)
MAEMFEATGLHAVVGYPLLAGGETLGALTFGWDHPRSFSPADEDVFSALAAQCAQALVRIRARDAEQARAVQAVEMSEALQRSLLTEPTQHPGCTVAARYRPAGLLAQIGGDWFDSFTTPDGLVHVVVGDVSGHDQDAAALMGQARNVLRGIAQTTGAAPADVVRRLDLALRDLRSKVYATLVLATVQRDPDGRTTVEWTNAGHPVPLVVRSDGRVEVLATRPEPMLGVDADRVRAGHTAVLEVGDMLLLHTDGLVERRRADLDDGLQWLADAVTAHVGSGGRRDDLCDHLLALVQGHTEDDVVVLTLTVEP